MLKRPARHQGEMGLFPTDEVSVEQFALVPSDREVITTVRAERNIRQHRLAWSLAQVLSEACDFLHDREDAMDFLKIKARHVKIVSDGKLTYFIPKSIAFAKLDQVAFGRLFNRWVYIVCNEIIPGLKESDLRDKIEGMVAPAPGMVGHNTGRF